MTDIRFATKVSSALRGAEVVLCMAPQSAWDDKWHHAALGTDWASALDAPAEDTKAGDMGNVGGTYGPEGAPRRLMVGVLPDSVARHNSPARTEAVRGCTGKSGLGGKKAAVIVRLDDPSHYTAVANAITRCFPLFNRATGGNGNGNGKPTGRVTICAVDADGNAIRASNEVKVAADTTQFVSRLVDTPPQEMNTSQMEAEARAACKGLKGVRVTSIVGDKLAKQGFGGIHGVGRTATDPPRLVCLEYKPARKARRSVGIVGKGIVYDTGGLSLKVGGSMPNMKCDMGGAAAALGAFLQLARTKSKDRVVCVLCLAENAIGPESYRPDDILVMHSGKTVEINNTDAEGRLVLADGVSYAARNKKCDVVFDAATLTGAALIITGDSISCTMSNREGLEQLAVEVGRDVGDLNHPILFIPEVLKQTLKSKVADMRNSVSNRMCPQTSAAGQFIYWGIEELDVPWVHLDIAGPAFRDGRGTGHGATLMAEMVRRIEDSHLEGN